MPCSARDRAGAPAAGPDGQDRYTASRSVIVRVPYRGESEARERGLNHGPGTPAFALPQASQRRGPRPRSARKTSTCRAGVLARLLLTIWKQKCAPVSCCLLERTSCERPLASAAHRSNHYRAVTSPAGATPPLPDKSGSRDAGLVPSQREPRSRLQINARA